MYLQIQVPIPTEAVPILIWVVTGLSGAIVALAMYVKKLHRKTTDMAERFTQAIEKNTNVTDNVKDALDRNTDVVGDLHKYIIGSLSMNHKEHKP